MFCCGVHVLAGVVAADYVSGVAVALRPLFLVCPGELQVDVSRASDVSQLVQKAVAPTTILSVRVNSGISVRGHINERASSQAR